MTFAIKPIASSAALVVCLLMGAPVRAQTCGPSQDCPQGFTCVQSTVAGTTPACPPDSDCPKADPTPPAPVYQCQPKTCQTDSECGAGMVCFTETSTACSGGAAVPPCPPNSDCPAPVKTETMCTTTTRSTCAFKWQLPCQNDASCGDGFTCHPTVIGACSGSAGVGSAGSASGDGGAGAGSATASAGDRPPSSAPSIPGDASVPECTTVMSFPGYCTPTRTSCVADSDCPAGWTCIDEPPAMSGSGVATPVKGAPAPAPVPVAADAGAPPAAQPVAPPTVVTVDAGPSQKTCAAPYDLGARYNTGQSSTTSGGAPSGSPDSSKGGAGASAPTVPAAAGNSGAPSGGGCSIDAGGDAARASGLILFTLLGILAVHRLRRS